MLDVPTKEVGRYEFPSGPESTFLSPLLLLRRYPLELQLCRSSPRRPCRKGWKGWAPHPGLQMQEASSLCCLGQARARPSTPNAVVHIHQERRCFATGLVIPGWVPCGAGWRS